jgi:hypothetical protein
MDDLVTYALLASSFFFAAISVGLLFRYRQVSQRISASSDLGRDLWQALEQRMKKQDERILDMMGRFEVLQARALAPPTAFVPPAPLISPPPAQPVAQPEEETRDVTELHHVAPQPKSQPESPIELDKTQVSALKLLSQKPMSTIEIKKALDLSREHTARFMKGLFDKGLVNRDDSEKPFVYRLTDEGKKYLF